MGTSDERGHISEKASRGRYAVETIQYRGAQQEGAQQGERHLSQNVGAKKKITATFHEARHLEQGEEIETRDAEADAI